MTAAVHYRYKSGTLSWDPSGAGSAVPITGVQSIRYGEGGETIDLMSDASELVQQAPLGRIKGRITVTTINQDVMEELALGDGALSFELEVVKNGRGSVAGAGKVVEFAAAILKDKDSGAGSSPGESSTLQFDAVDDGTGAIYTVTDEA